MKLFKVVKHIIITFFDKIELMTHNEYTIASYFRKKGVQIGENCRILIKDFNSEPYLIKIGNNCTIAPHVSFITHDGGAGIFRKEIPHLNVFGKTDIKDNCFSAWER
jgi:acetyltransferase-like isoleucine patch superfamily enzyme